MAGQVITVAQQKGGSGKTTLAAHLAVGFRAEGKTVALIDLDPQGSLGRWYMTRLDKDPAFCEGLEFTTSSAWGIALECRKLTASHDLVIIDTPPKADSDLRPALRVADLVIVPVSVSQVDLWATEGVLDLAHRENRKSLLVMNRSRAGTRLAAEVEKAAQSLDAPMALASLANRVGYAEAIGHGSTILEGRRSPAQKEVLDLVADVTRHLQG